MRRLLLVLSLSLSFLCVVPSARAGTYDVYSCWAGADSYRNPAANGKAWHKGVYDPHFLEFDQCGSSDNGLGLVSQGGGQVPQGGYGELVFAAPSGTQVTRLRMWRTAWSYGTGTGAGSQRNYINTLADGVAHPRGDNYDGSSDVPHGMAGTTDTAQHGLIPANLLDVDLANATPSQVAYRIGCAAGAGCPTADSRGDFASGVKVYGTIVTLRDTSDPELTVAEGTGLLTPGVVHRGRETVRVRLARDNSGIKRLAVFADDATSPVGVVDYERNNDKCQWWVARPCQNVSEVDVPVDTSRVPDGERRFVVRAYDAAENVRAFTSVPVTVKNGADARPESFGTPVPVEVRGAANGEGASDRAVLTAGFDGRRGSALRVRFSRRVVVVGRLADELGRPIAGAEVVVGARPFAGGAPQPLGTARTDAQGRYRFVVAARGPSRGLVVAYRSHVGDAKPAAVRELRLQVGAGVRLGVAPRVVRNGRSIRFAGALLGRPLPSAGKLVDMQVRIGRRWHTFATVRARGRRATFRHRYRFTRTFTRVTYRFRALARADGAYPYATGASRTVKVTVRP